MKEVNFYTSDGVELNGILYEENNKPQNKSVILSVHGMTSNCFKKKCSNSKQSQRKEIWLFYI